MPNRTPLTAKATELMIDLQIVAQQRNLARVIALAREAAEVFGQMDLDRMDDIYRLNHGRGRRARDRRVA